MKLVHHIKISKILINKLDEKLMEGFKVNRLAFYIGSIFPDLNCIYPAHRLNTTNKRLAKKIEIIDNMNKDSLYKSFELGIITHYVCDYFCYAHSNETIGFIHKHYEKQLYNMFELHKEVFINKENKNIVTEWNEALDIIQHKLLSKTDTMDVKSHASMIMEQIKTLNDNYMKNSNGMRRDSDWADDIEQCKRDLEYTLFMCENVLALIVDPVRCISTCYV